MSTHILFTIGRSLKRQLPNNNNFHYRHSIILYEMDATKTLKQIH